MNASVRHKYVNCAAAGKIEAAACADRLGIEFRMNSELEHDTATTITIETYFVAACYDIGQL